MAGGIGPPQDSMRRALVGTSQKESARTKPCKEPVLRAANPRRRAGSRVQGVEECNGSCRPRRRSRLAEGVVSLGSVKTLMKETSEFVNRGRANSESEQLGALPPDPQDLSLSCQNLLFVLVWGSELDSLPTQSRPLGRRSGRIPALPYPPPRPPTVYAKTGRRPPAWLENQKKRV